MGQPEKLPEFLVELHMEAAGAGSMGRTRGG